MIDRAEAVDRAAAAVRAQRGDDALQGRSPLVRKEGDVWHVSFPYSDPGVVGGEPHVRIAEADGAVLEVYATQ